MLPMRTPPGEQPIVEVKQPVELVASPLESQLPAMYVAADGFPIDPMLQKQARLAALGYGGLALYYIAVMPFVLKFVRWGSLQQAAEDLLARAGILAPALAYIAANVILAVCAWRVISMSRGTSRAVVGMSLGFTLWTCGTLTLSLGRTFAESPSRVELLHVFLSIGLLVGYLACAASLFLAVRRFNARRDAALAQLEGRIST